jgi:hypothetical protein
LGVAVGAAVGVAVGVVAGVVAGAAAGGGAVLVAEGCAPSFFPHPDNRVAAMMAMMAGRLWAWGGFMISGFRNANKSPFVR